jgi:hypothetical protein
MLRVASAALHARELAKLVPDSVRCVITLGLPFAREKTLDKFFCAVYRSGWMHRTRSSER